MNIISVGNACFFFLTNKNLGPPEFYNKISFVDFPSIAAVLIYLQNVTS